ncbi:MAG: response regulator transcription factor [Candidatus Brocadiae bacterium]|nr:response regulator transcription factor [Candidatus Brocadiia bacterium]
MRVLVVEDYAPLRKSLARGLRQEGFAVDLSADGEEGLWYAQSNDYDVIVLDLMLPKLDGLGILRRLRGEGHKAPVLILTAKGEVDDRVHGLNLGADDYLVKPFAFKELLARIQALVRRRYDSHDPMLCVGDLTIDTAARTATRSGRALDLTAREYALLELLALRAGEVVTRTDIWEHVYEFDSSAQSNVVEVYIGYLRRKLEQGGLPRLIHTRRGQGYVLEERP